jgi:twitching motility protein PilT
MSRLFEMLNLLRSQKSNELLISPGATVQYRLFHQWQPLSHDKISSGDCHEICFSILSEPQRKVLQEHHIITGSFTHLEMSVRFEIAGHKNGYSGLFRLLPASIPGPQDIGLPQVLVDISQRRQGLVILAGPKGHGKWTTVSSLLENVAREKGVLISTLELAVKNLPHSHKGTFLHHEIQRHELATVDEWPVLSSSDIVALDLPVQRGVFDFAMGLVEGGRMVFLTLEAPTTTEALNKLFHLYTREERGYVTRRVASGLQAVIGQRLVWGVQGQSDLALEILVNAPEVRAAIADDDLTKLDEIMRTSGEKTGMRTLNQSLLQNVIRRKIDIKSAFENSSEPAELDQLLSKVGI